MIGSSSDGAHEDIPTQDYRCASRADVEQDTVHCTVCRAEVPNPAHSVYYDMPHGPGLWAQGACCCRNVKCYCKVTYDGEKAVKEELFDCAAGRGRPTTSACCPFVFTSPFRFAILCNRTQFTQTAPSFRTASRHSGLRPAAQSKSSSLTTFSPSYVALQ